MQSRGQCGAGVDAGRRAEPGRPGRVRIRSLAARGLTAALLAAFAALLAQPLQVLQAQTPTEVWSASITTGTLSTLVGVWPERSPAVGSMTDRDFDYDGTTYTFSHIRVTGTGSLQISMTSAFSQAALDNLSFQAGSATFALSDGTTSDDKTVNWNSAGLSWSSGQTIAVKMLAAITASTDATLSALTVNDGTNDLTLVPAFAAGTYVYAADVGNAVTTVTLTATVNDDGAAVSGVTLGGTAIADSDFTDGITVPSLVVGDNVIVVTVTAEDTTTQTYTITVTRLTAPASTDATLSALTVNDGTNDLTLVPAFAPGTYVYAVNAGNAVTTVTLTATVNDDGAAVSGVTLGGTAIADSDFTDGITVPSLVVGDNVVVVTVTAEDATTQTYTITVTRLTAPASTDATLSALTVNDGTNDLTLVPAFAPGTYVYAVNAGNAVTTVTLTATVNDDGAAVSSVTLGGTAIADSDFTDGITVPSLVVGDNVVVVTVTAEDATTQTYTITVTRLTAPASTDATLSALTVNDGTNDLTLVPAFAPGTYVYAVNAGNAVTTVTLTATVNDDGAAVSGVTLGGTAIADSDFTDGITVPSLVVGDNVVVVTVTAEDATTQTYTITVTRVTATTPEVTISADKTSAVLKGDDLTYTVTRTGSTTDDLPVTVVLTQTGDFLAAADLTKTVTIAAGQSTQTLTVAAAIFQDFAPGATVEGGTLTAAVQAGTGYVRGTPASVDVTIVVALTVGFEMASYSVAEEAGSLAVKLVARTGAGALAPDADVVISFYTAELDPLEARIVQDYESVSVTVTFAPSDFTADGSVFKAEQTASVTIVDNTIDEQAERFAVLLDIVPGLLREYDNFVDTNGAACPDPLCPALVTIIDTDPASADITGIEITSRPANGISYLAGEAIAVAVTYDEAVAVTTTSGTPTLDLEIDVAQAASYTSISSDNLVLTFSYTIAGDDQDQNGIVIPAGSIDLSGGTITGRGTSTAANLAYPRIGRDASQKVNTDPRVISGGVAVTSSPAAKTDTYGVGETIRFTVTFDSPVAVDTTSGTPVLGFRLANSSTTPANKDLDYVSGSGTAALTFEYVVQSGDTDTNGISVRNNWLDANGGANGAITHATTGRDARLNHGRPGNNGNFPGHKVDGSLGPSVPNDWVLKPSGLGGGDQFRLIFLTSLGDVGSDTDIAVYNTWVQGVAGGGHAAIQAYGAAFNVVGCTASIDARDNTHSTYTNANKGVPIYWLNGAKVADEYEDFYDGSWDDEVNDKNQLGFNGLDTSNVTNYPWTGCDDDGTEATGMALGDTTPRVGRPNSTDTGNGPIGSVTTESSSSHRPMYGLSAVFTVMTDTAPPGAPTGLKATAHGPEKIDLSWTAPSSIGGAAITGYKIEFSINGGTTWSDLVADTGATDTTRSHSSNLNADNTRHYRVSAINSGGAGPASNVAFATTAAANVLVSNTGQNGDPAATQAIGDQDKTHSQGFETGSNPAGYRLASVGVHVSDADLAAGETFTVHIYTADGSGGLSALAYTLTSPNIYKNNAVNKFTAPDGATLAAGAAYHVVFQATGNAASDVVLGVTSSNEQDTGSELLWTIEDARRFEGSPSSAGTNYKVSVNGTAKPILVPGDWSLKPTGLIAGDQFRLIFISSTGRNAVPIDIADYNTFVQGLAAAGHTDIQAYSAGFSVVGCTAATDARDNTGTTGTGVPIYWLNGELDNAKVADDYADFYDGDWDEERESQNRDESGANGPNTSQSFNRPLTGCKHNGTERFSMGSSFALGKSSVIAGNPNSSVATSGPIGSNITAPRSSIRPFYGLSTVFQAASSALPDVPTRLRATAVGETQIDLYWIAPASNDGLAVTGYRIEVSSNGGVSWTDLVSNTNSDATTYSHTGLLAGATRTYRVSAINSTGLGNPSGTAFAITAPAQVMGLMVELGDMQLVVNWTALDNATGYRVQWKSGVQDYNTGDRQAVIRSGSTIRHTIESLSNGTAYTVQVTATKTGANDGPPSAEVMETPAEPMETELSLTPVNPRVDETDGTAVLTVTLAPASSGTVTVDYATSDITADAGMDYTATSGTLTFMPGETSKPITVTLLNDTVYELIQRFHVTLSNPTGAVLSAASVANVNIASEDAKPTASMADVTVLEDAGMMTLTLALSHESSLAVSYETASSDVSGTATMPNDYFNFLQGADTTITVPAGDLSATFDITIFEDLVAESDETIIIQWTLTPGIEATPTSFTFTGTITDNDETGVSVSKTALTVTEQDTTGDTYTVVLNTQPTANVTVTVDGHAGTDVTPSPATLTFTPTNWETAQPVTVTAGNDADTADDTVTLTHSATSADANYQGITIAGVTVTVNDNDTDGGFTGGGGGGPSGPTPSDVDFEWNVTRDIEALDSGHDLPSGMWSDGAVLWLAENGAGVDDAIYAYDLASGERVEDREFELDSDNREPRGVWSDRGAIWISDSGQNKLFAYDLATGARLEDRDIRLAEGNSDPHGIWSDGSTMWVLDGNQGALFAYDLASGELLAEYALHDDNDEPHGIWSDGVTVWVSNHDPKRLFAYRLPAPDPEAGEDEALELERVTDEEFTKLPRASNNSPRGIWSDGDVMYVVDESDDRVYTYNMPDATDARLASLSLSGVDFGEFSPGHTEYEGVAGEDATETTVEAEAEQREAVVVIEPADSDEVTDGYQVTLDGLDEIVITVTSADESRTKVYRVHTGGAVDAGEAETTDAAAVCLRGAVTVGLSLVVYEGGSVDDLESCAQSRNITALYVTHEGKYAPYILGAPDFVTEAFVALFPDGLPPLTPLIAKSDGPPSADPGEAGDGDVPEFGPDCLRGEIATGFTLVLHEGGSVEDLDSCAQGSNVSAVYALVNGKYVSYILGAPDFVNKAFVALFPEGLAPVTPLVAKSDELPATTDSDARR